LILHVKKTAMFFTVFLAGLLIWLPFVSRHPTPFSEVVFPMFLLWLVFFIFTYSIRIDEKGISAVYAFFQMKLWVSKIIEWDDIASVSFVAGRKSFSEDTILVTPIDRKTTLWSDNMIAIPVYLYDYDKIVPLLVEKGVDLPPGLMVKMNIEPKGAEAIEAINAYKIEKTNADKAGLVTFSLVAALFILSGMLAYLGIRYGQESLVVVGFFTLILGPVIVMVLRIK